MKQKGEVRRRGSVERFDEKEKPASVRRKQSSKKPADEKVFFEVVETHTVTDDKPVWRPNVELDAEHSSKEWKPDTWAPGACVRFCLVVRSFKNVNPLPP